ncbi:helix-turn-helix transcriptional regulator [Thiomicrorhabdus sp. 6S2-11]|uniref:Helix-turn-helix transcriptional regulator n=1 Tax=Thiomicrorhabdus marina TaxID=2818442 RepID=A0ABS3Q8N0_9GAMM|nr:helix-turn-helix transcriptional regulator [Thiomicrorhabdus marina]MBO1928488.1 helix-turn-helix transcriptional regulator [Thiomicrorhabdus marina]
MKTLYSPQSYLLGAWLRSQREAKGLTMRQVAGLIGKPHSFIAKIEEGQRRLDVVEFVWYCQKLELDAHAGLDLLLESNA